MSSETPSSETRVINLSEFRGRGEALGRAPWVVAAWMVVEWLVVTNPLQISSRIRIAALKLFGARIGERVIMRPRVRVKAPWKLSVGDNCWIGEGVWFHNQDQITIENDVAISQETMLTTGSHRHRVNMELVTSPILIRSGAWVTSRCLIAGGTEIGTSAVISPMTVVRGTVPPNSMFPPGGDGNLRPRF